MTPAASRTTIPGRWNFRAITWDIIPKAMAKPIVNAGLSISIQDEKFT